MLTRLRIPTCLALPLVCGLACTSPRDRARADSAQALASQQRVLMDKLVSQRDSVSRLLFDADTFLSQIDHSISRVKGLPRATLVKNSSSESPIEDQLQARKDMLHRVDALVSRARETARQVAELKDRQAQLMAENAALRDSLNADVQRIAELTTSLDKQAQTIAELEARVDELGNELEKAKADYSRAYYVIGTEDELLKKGVVVREGGANLIFRRVGRTLQPARELKTELFTPIDIREVRAITLPDTAHRYQIVSRQSLDDAKVGARDGASFRGELQIADADKFWAASRFLIIVER